MRRFASERHQADAIAGGAALLEQLDDLQHAAAALGRHRAREIGDDDDIDARAAEAGQRHGYQQRDQAQDDDAHGPADRGGPAT